MGAPPMQGQPGYPGGPMQPYPGGQMMGPGGVPNLMAPPGEGKSWMITLLLCGFLGYLGVHRFYTGHYLLGALQLITCGGFGIWAFVDLIFILMGKYTDAQGRPLVKN